MKRLLCIWFPNFPMQRFNREQPEHRSRPCILFHEESRSGLRVVACSRECADAGIASGQPLADARSLLPAAHFAEHDPEADEVALKRLAWSCQQFSPYVGIEPFAGLACLVMDMTGGTHLFGGDQLLARRVIEFLAKQQFFAHVSIAHRSAQPGPSLVTAIKREHPGRCGRFRSKLCVCRTRH